MMMMLLLLAFYSWGKYPGLLVVVEAHNLLKTHVLTVYQFHRYVLDILYKIPAVLSSAACLLYWGELTPGLLAVVEDHNLVETYYVLRLCISCHGDKEPRHTSSQ